MSRTKIWIFVGAFLVLATGAILAIVVNQPTETEKYSPTHKTFLPKNKNINDLGGWQRISPPDKEPVFAFSDKINETQISVSQQAMPEEFNKDPEKSVEELAKNENSTNIFSIETLKIYTGTSAKGPQTVIFFKDGTLVFIKSQGVVEESDWVDYIKNLE